MQRVARGAGLSGAREEIAMKLFGNRKGAEHIAARKTEKKTGGLKRLSLIHI